MEAQKKLIETTNNRKFEESKLLSINKKKVEEENVLTKLSEQKRSQALELKILKGQNDAEINLREVTRQKLLLAENREKVALQAIKQKEEAEILAARAQVRDRER